MKHFHLTIGVLLMVAAAGCTKNSSEPSSVTTTTVATTTTSTATTTTTSVPVQASFTLSGVVTDAASNQRVSGPVFEIIAGANVGRRFEGGTDGSYTAANLTPGTFTLRAWAPLYLVNDIQVTITNANVQLNVSLTLAPPTTSTTTTTVPALVANFTYSPSPCTISNGGATVDCTVDASASTGNIVGWKWEYKGKTATGNSRISLQIACSDLGALRDDTIFVTLTVTDDTGATATITKGVIIVKNGACGF